MLIVALRSSSLFYVSKDAGCPVYPSTPSNSYALAYRFPCAYFRLGTKTPSTTKHGKGHHNLKHEWASRHTSPTSPKNHLTLPFTITTLLTFYSLTTTTLSLATSFLFSSPFSLFFAFPLNADPYYTFATLFRPYQIGPSERHSVHDFNIPQTDPDVHQPFHRPDVPSSSRPADDESECCGDGAVV